MTLVDILIIALVLVSAFVALMRGFVREVLLLCTLALAVVLTIALYRMIAPGLSEAAGDSWLIHGGVGFAVFLGLFLMLRLATLRIRAMVSKDKPHPWDQIGGFFLGVARGFVIAALLFQGYSLIYTGDGMPGWITQARLYPVVASVSNVLNMGAARTIKGRADTDTRDLAERVPLPVHRANGDGEVPEGGPGYSSDDRSAIGRLLRNKLDPPE